MLRRSGTRHAPLLDRARQGARPPGRRGARPSASCSASCWPSGPPSSVRHRPGQLPQQGPRSPTTTSRTRTSSAARPCSRAFQVPEGQTIVDLFTPDNQPKMIELAAELRRHARCPQRRHPPDARSSGPTTSWPPRPVRPTPPPASPARSCQRAIAREPAGSAAEPRSAPPTASTTISPAPRDRRRAVARQPDVGRVPPHRQPGRDPQGPAAVLPGAARSSLDSRERHPRPDVVRLEGNQALDRAGATRPRCWCSDTVDAVDFATGHHRHHRRPDAAQGRSTTTSRAACSSSAPSPSS